MARPDLNMTTPPPIPEAPETLAADAQIIDQLLELGRHEVTFHPIGPDDGAALAKLHAEHPEARLPHAPAYVLRKGGRVVGCVAMNSLPIHHIWMPATGVHARECHDVVKFVENLLRIGGHAVIGTIMDVQCGSYPYKERHGYHELVDERLCVKRL